MRNVGLTTLITIHAHKICANLVAGVAVQIIDKEKKEEVIIERLDTVT